MESDIRSFGSQVCKLYNSQGVFRFCSCISFVNLVVHIRVASKCTLVSCEALILVFISCICRRYISDTNTLDNSLKCIYEVSKPFKKSYEHRI